MAEGFLQMDVLGWEQHDEDYDLLILNSYVLLDLLRRRNDVLHHRILAHWDMFQMLRD